MPRRKQSATEKEYSKQRRRLKQAISRSEKQGYIFPENILPDKPKRITKASVRRLAKITPEALRQKGEFLFEDTGEIIPVKGNKDIIKQEIKRRKQEYKERKFDYESTISTDYDFYDRVVISNWKGTLESFSEGEAYSLLKAWFNAIYNENGEHNTAIMLQDGAENGNILTWEVVYKEELAIMYMSSMMDYIPEQGILYKEEMLDKINFMKYMSDAFESLEDWDEPL